MNELALALEVPQVVRQVGVEPAHEGREDECPLGPVRNRTRRRPRSDFEAERPPQRRVVRHVDRIAHVGERDAPADPIDHLRSRRELEPTGAFERLRRQRVDARVAARIPLGVRRQPRLATKQAIAHRPRFVVVGRPALGQIREAHGGVGVPAPGREASGAKEQRRSPGVAREAVGEDTRRRVDLPAPREEIDVPRADVGVFGVRREDAQVLALGERPATAPRIDARQREERFGVAIVSGEDPQIRGARVGPAAVRCQAAALEERRLARARRRRIGADGAIRGGRRALDREEDDGADDAHREPHERRATRAGRPPWHAALIALAMGRHAHTISHLAVSRPCKSFRRFCLFSIRSSSRMWASFSRSTWSSSSSACGESAGSSRPNTCGRRWAARKTAFSRT